MTTEHPPPARRTRLAVLALRLNLSVTDAHNRLVTGLGEIGYYSAKG